MKYFFPLYLCCWHVNLWRYMICFASQVYRNNSQPKDIALNLNNYRVWSQRLDAVLIAVVPLCFWYHDLRRWAGMLCSWGISDRGGRPWHTFISLTSHGRWRVGGQLCSRKVSLGYDCRTQRLSRLTFSKCLHYDSSSFLLLQYVYWDCIHCLPQTYQLEKQWDNAGWVEGI